MKAVHYILPTVICLSLMIPIGIALKSEVDRIEKQKQEDVEIEKDRFLYLENADSLSIAEPDTVPIIKHLSNGV
jgi:archaellum biogenesis protein FlaJ (TadC family)